MTTINLTVSGAHVVAACDGPLTSGMVGLRVVISYDDSWDGLSKTLVCRNSMGNTAFDQVYIVANIGGRATVAPEVMVAQRHLYLGIEGYTREGNLVMPTIWADCGLIQPGAESNGAESQETTPEIWMQLESQIGTLDELETDHQGNLVSAINELSQEAESSRKAAEQEFGRIQDLCDQNAANLTAARKDLETDIQNTETLMHNRDNYLASQITECRVDAASGDASLRASIQNVSNRLENKITALEEEMAKVPEPEPVAEPQYGDLPRVFLDGDLPAGLEETQATLTYISRTHRFTAHLTLTGTQNNDQEKKRFIIRMFHDADRTQALNKSFRDWGYASNCYELRSNFTDHSHSRHIVASRLWSEVMASRSDYASLPAQLRESPRNGAADGFPVKVYVGGIYHGLYTWNMGVERWNIQGGNQSVLKALTNSSTAEPDTPCNFRALWSGTAGDHWSLEAGSNQASSLNQLIAFVQESDDNQFRASLGQYLDVQSAMDYYLFQYALCGTDGLGKNLHLVTYDGTKWFCGCGDLDATFLLNTTGKAFLKPGYRCPLDYLEAKSLLWSRLGTAFSQELRDRYDQLRAQVLSFANICSHFEQFTDVIDASLYQEDVEICPTIPQADANNIYQIRNAIRDRLDYCDQNIDALVQESIYATIDYSLNPLADATWLDNYNYTNGILTARKNDYCTTKFALQNCLYKLTYSEGLYPTLYVWDENDTFLGQVENQIIYFTGQSNYRYAFLLYKTDGFDSSTVSIMPVNNAETATEVVTLKPAELTYNTDNNAIISPMVGLFGLDMSQHLQNPTPAIAAKIHHADALIVIGNTYAKPVNVDPEKMLTFSFYSNNQKLQMATRMFGNNLESALSYFTEHNTTIHINY